MRTRNVSESKFFVILLAFFALALILPACGGGGGGGDSGAPSGGGSSDPRYTCIKGTITAGGGRAVGAEVTVAGKSTRTNGDGDYEIRDIPNGSHTITAAFNGRTQSITLVWRDGEWTKHVWNPQF